MTDRSWTPAAVRRPDMSLQRGFDNLADRDLLQGQALYSAPAQPAAMARRPLGQHIHHHFQSAAIYRRDHE